MVRIHNEKTQEEYDYLCQGIFFFVGMVPATDFLKGQLELDDRGWIHTNEMMETDIPGVYAVGDVAIAATAAEIYIEEQNAFKQNVLENDAPIVLGFWSPEVEGSLDMMNGMRAENEKSDHSCKFMDIDISRKKSMAALYKVELIEKQPALTIRVEHGEIVSQ